MNAELKATHEARVARRAATTKTKTEEDGRPQPRIRTTDDNDDEDGNDAARRHPTKKRPRLRDDPTSASKDRERLPFGTFSTGTSLFRNHLHPGESLQEGHVTLSNLVLPDCVSAVCTTFCADEESDLMKWLRDDAFRGIKDALMVMDGGGGGEDHRVVGDAKLTPMTCPTIASSYGGGCGGWYSIRVTPHTGGCLHAKLLLFRSVHGLRVVVCGSNLYQAQWETDRDALWIQDFFASSGQQRGRGEEEDEGYSDADDDDNGYSTSGNNVNTNNRTRSAPPSLSFGQEIRSFLDDLTKCRELKDTRMVQSRLEDLFVGIDFSTAAARFTYSFPRRKKDDSSKSRGGWQKLADNVQRLFNYECKEGMTNHPAEGRAGKKKDDDWMVYAMSGSFGNVQPDFLAQMQQAMSGISIQGSGSSQKAKKAPTAAWEDVRGIGCLWPSNETAVGMHLPSFIGSARAIPRSHWNTVPRAAQQQIFFDAPPNPPECGLPQLDCHPFSHAKVMYATKCNADSTSNSLGSNGPTVLYVGSHNFSKAAWGIRNVMPKNVEAGVVLLSSDKETQEEWLHRLPCLLPSRSKKLTTGNYIPASVPTYIREVYESGQAEMALGLLRDLWHNDESHGGSSKAAAVPKTKAAPQTAEQETIVLCDSDSD